MAMKTERKDMRNLHTEENVPLSLGNTVLGIVDALTLCRMFQAEPLAAMCQGFLAHT
jgi:hypothetical protein